MSLIMSAGAWMIFEFPGKRRDLDEHIAKLKTSGDEICERLAGKTSTDHNREWLAHIIGIERWGCRRLAVLMGEVLLEEEYDGYRPSIDLPWGALEEEFATTRAETIKLAERLEEQPVDSKVPHNSYGALSGWGWLEYIRFHAAVTAILIR